MKNKISLLLCFILSAGMMLCACTRQTADTTSRPANTGSPEQKESTTNLSKNTPAADDGKYLWLITIEEKRKGKFFEQLGGDEVPCEYTVEIYAVNDNSPSPYEGEFTVAGKIHMYWNVKEDYDMPDMDFLEFESDHVIQNCSFRLVSNDLAPLTEGSDPLLQGSAESGFKMPTKGENPANFAGSANGFGVGQNKELNMTADCRLIQINSEVELITDVFGNFKGKIERLDAGKVPSDIELATLVP